MNRAALIQFVPVALFGIACSSLLGIEEIYEDPQNATGGGTGGGLGGVDGSGGSGTGSPSAGGSGGTSNAGGSGGSGAGGDAGGAGMGEGGDGTVGSSGGATTGSGGTTGTGGDGGTGGTGGDTGSGGTGGTPGDMTVRGKVVNHWLQPISGVTVMIGSQEAQTASDGSFEVADVPEEYDAMMIVRYRRYGNDGPEYGWVYQGLTRRDPTLQVYAGLSLRSANIEYTPRNVDLSGNPRVLGTALGGDYGDWYREGTNAVITSTSWYGPETVTMSAHGLLWEETSGLPTSYVSYATLSAPVALTDSTGTTAFELDLADSTVASGTISGSVTSPTTDNRENRVFVRFASNAVMHVIEHYGSTLMADFTYTVPSLPNASITVAASEGTAFRGAAAVAHRDNVSPGQNNVNLTIPTPPVLNAPANGTALSDNTVFSWSSNAQTFVWHAESAVYYEGIYIVTAKKQVSIPEFPNGWELRREMSYGWRVQTHGDHSSVDEMTGEEGFIDEFGPSYGDEPEGPRRSSGSFTISVARGFDTPP